MIGGETRQESSSTATATVPFVFSEYHPAERFANALSHAITICDRSDPLFCNL